MHIVTILSLDPFSSLRTRGLLTMSRVISLYPAPPFPFLGLPPGGATLTSLSYLPLPKQSDAGSPCLTSQAGCDTPLSSPPALDTVALPTDARWDLTKAHAQFPAGGETWPGTITRLLSLCSCEEPQPQQVAGQEAGQSQNRCSK